MMTSDRFKPHKAVQRRMIRKSLIKCIAITREGKKDYHIFSIPSGI